MNFGIRVILASNLPLRAAFRHLGPLQAVCTEPAGSKADGARHVSEVGNVWTPKAILAAMMKQRDELARRYGDKDAEVIELQRQIDALRQYIGTAVSADTLAALENVAGPLPEDLVAVDLLPR